MGEAKKSGKRKTPKSSSAIGPSSRKTRARRTGQKTSGRRPPQQIHFPLEDAQLTPVADIPDQVQIDEVANHLDAGDREAFAHMQQLLAEHLGSHAAARLWLVALGTGFETTALAAIRAGQAKLVLATLQSQWGASPTYA